MKIKYLDGEKFFNAFKNGAEMVSARKSHLNEINLFPVPDSDTGNNMSLTLSATAVKVNPESSIYKTAKLISDNAVESARGNSGLILAQFFSGLHNKMKEKHRLDTGDFARAVKETIPYLYKNIDQPKEGTMVSVIRDWADHIHRIGDSVDDFVSLFEQAMETAHSSLEETRTKIEILKKNNTVDAGAQGFVYFLEGMINYWTNSSKLDMVLAEVSAASEELERKEETIISVRPENLRYRYCTEVFMLSDSSSSEIKELLHNKGDSLIVGSSGRKMRVHIHTDQPAHIISFLKDRGQLVDQKVDDMKRQAEMVYDRKNDIAVVTDSIADLPQELIDSYQIHVIPLNLIIDGINYLDKLTISPDYFYNYVEEADDFPSSSQPTVEYIYNYLFDLSEYYSSILLISVSEKLSGTGKSFRAAKNRIKAEKDIDISYIDSKLNSGAQGLLVLKAAELIEKGLELSEIEKTIREYRENSNIYVNVNTIDYMIKGGRVSAMKGFLARIFNLKPIISLDETGDGIIWDKAFSRNTVNKKILDRVLQSKKEGRLEKYNVIHADAPDLAEEMSQKIIVKTGLEPEYIINISSITALNSGEDAVAVGILAE